MALERGEEEINDEAMNGGRSLKYSVPTLDSNYPGSSEFDKEISLEKTFKSPLDAEVHFETHRKPVVWGEENIYEWSMSIFSSHVIMRDVIILDTGVERDVSLNLRLDRLSPVASPPNVLHESSSVWSTKAEVPALVAVSAS
ncbi:hypothetical protein KIN20_028089 [Parelaphostrongylus tenuis]|uniref:Uncharacterized protein n=1 Tax=Parelaphostrongylus tenuis TaxID=148309 RepID=A0AAD5R083_PARTN|nr:hypothetical protein KIN20_028089 [Parelaphostrongylus tenuis]